MTQKDEERSAAWFNFVPVIIRTFFSGARNNDGEIMIGVSCNESGVSFANGGCNRVKERFRGNKKEIHKSSREWPIWGIIVKSAAISIGHHECTKYELGRKGGYKYLQTLHRRAKVYVS